MASFETYNPILKKLEGGFQKSSKDPGNYNSLGHLVGTNFGISGRFYESIIKRVPTEADMQAITPEQAKQIFKTKFWDNCQADQIRDQSIANTIVDHHINAGGGIRLAQEVLNNYFGHQLKEDNVMGPITLAALNKVNPSLFVHRYNMARSEHYRKNNNPTFIDGWLRRAEKFAYRNPKTSISAGVLIVMAGFFLPCIN